MANDETLAALERAARHREDAAQKYQRWISFDSPPPTWIDAYKAAMKEAEADAALIRALIKRERAGGERAQIVALLDGMAGQHIDRNMKFKTPQDEGAFDALANAAIRVKAGAHLAGPRVLSVNVVQQEGE